MTTKHEDQTRVANFLSRVRLGLFVELNRLTRKRLLCCARKYKKKLASHLIGQQNVRNLNIFQQVANFSRVRLFSNYIIQQWNVLVAIRIKPSVHN